MGTGLVGRTGDMETIDLPDDRMPNIDTFDGNDGVNLRPYALHYAPLEHDGLRERSAIIAQWISKCRPALIVSDVSVEVAMLARLCATHVAFIRLSGRRNDPAHLEAFRAATMLIAPFAKELEDTDTQNWVRDKTVYCPGIIPSGVSYSSPSRNSILVVGGKGGRPQDGDRLAAFAVATPGYNWRVIGPVSRPKTCPNNLKLIGWTDDPLTEIARSEIIVGAAGDGLVNAVISVGRLFICHPEPRPFDEQVQKASALERARAAVVIDHWPSPAQWPDLLEQARRLDLSKQQALGDRDGAARAFATLSELSD